MPERRSFRDGRQAGSGRHGPHRSAQRDKGERRLVANSLQPISPVMPKSRVVCARPLQRARKVPPAKAEPACGPIVVAAKPKPLPPLPVFFGKPAAVVRARKRRG